MKRELINLYMDTAYRFAEESKAKRKKVGCVVVKNNSIISFGWNGTPSGFENDCETKEYADNYNYDPEDFPFEDETGHYKLVTKPYVLHAEQNAISKLATSTESSIGSSMFLTLSPCQSCAVLLIESKIKEVYYSESYRDQNGIALLRRAGIGVIKVPHKNNNNNEEHICCGKCST